jgi:hypothetical protein
LNMLVLTFWLMSKRVCTLQQKKYE